AEPGLGGFRSEQSAAQPRSAIGHSQRPVPGERQCHGDQHGAFQRPSGHLAGGEQRCHGQRYAEPERAGAGHAGTAWYSGNAQRNITPTGRRPRGLPAGHRQHPGFRTMIKVISRNLSLALAFTLLLCACSVLPERVPVELYELPPSTLEPSTQEQGATTPTLSSLRLATPSASDALGSTRLLVQVENGSYQAHPGAR